MYKQIPGVLTPKCLGAVQNRVIRVIAYACSKPFNECDAVLWFLVCGTTEKSEKVKVSSRGWIFFRSAEVSESMTRKVRELLSNYMSSSTVSKRITIQTQAIITNQATFTKRSSLCRHYIVAVVYLDLMIIALL